MLTLVDLLIYLTPFGEQAQVHLFGDAGSGIKILYIKNKQLQIINQAVVLV